MVPLHWRFINPGGVLNIYVDCCLLRLTHYFYLHYIIYFDENKFRIKEEVRQNSVQQTSIWQNTFITFLIDNLTKFD
jgi:hypothetical protein